MVLGSLTIVIFPVLAYLFFIISLSFQLVCFPLWSRWGKCYPVSEQTAEQENSMDFGDVGTVFRFSVIGGYIKQEENW